MDEEQKINTPVNLDAQDMQAIENFRKQKKTSVLTVMFTDIKDFTRLTETKGDEYSSEIRKTHDDILVRAVEEGGAGKVLKRIGDSIMAVFAEPSAAVERALLIQERLRSFNADPANPDKILVRIGLHMGQITVEGSIGMDIFGGVVNRASRIKEMAGGGHVYISYTVFDSARGWILNGPGHPYSWKLHGQYFVKGVEEPLAVYEVFDSGHVRPQPPLKGRKKRNMPVLVSGIGLVVLGAAAAISVLQYRSTSVSFRNVHLNTKLFLDDKVEIVLDGKPDDDLRASLTQITPGRHIIYYDVSYMVRYYAAMDVKRGRNIIEPVFNYNELPELSRSLMFEKGAANRSEASETGKYLIYEKGKSKKDAEARIHFVIQAKRDPADREKIIFDYDVDVALNGREVARKHITAGNAAADTDGKTVSLTIYKDDYHYYYASYCVSGTSTQLDVGSGYIEYEKP